MVQILLNNFLTDFPAMAISSDDVDTELIEKPRPWDIRFIRNFMIDFGLVSSIFDFLTFAALLFVLNATPEQFRTGWFIESVMTEVLIIMVMRTWKPFYTSKASRPLMLAMILVLIITLALPCSEEHILIDSGSARVVEPFTQAEGIEKARVWLEEELEHSSAHLIQHLLNPVPEHR